ncbi:MAG: DUF2971 domain-containing protein [Planctomycetales bacterium]
MLWSHYAEKHRGVCLGFDVLRASVERVQYETNRLFAEFDESGEPFGLSNELRAKLRTTKCQEWAYEREWRIFVPLSDAVQEGNLYFRWFGDDIRLAEVIVGSDCEQLEKVREDTAKYHLNACVYKARLAFNHFKVVPLESSVP